jgi:S1-C subfamily serine protease
MPRAANCLTPMLFMLASGNLALAQSDLNLVPPVPGEARPFPSDLVPLLDNSDADIGSTIAAASASMKEYKSNVRSTRNPRDVAVYRDVAPAVVLVVVKDGFGSGSLLEDKTILTNWHVVRGNRQVNVILNLLIHSRYPARTIWLLPRSSRLILFGT